MSDNGKSEFWAPLLLGFLAAASSKSDAFTLDVKSVLVTRDGPVIHAVDKDGDNLLITVDVKIVADDAVPVIPDEPN